MTRGLDGCLNVYAAEEWAGARTEIQALDPLSKEGAQMRRHFFSAAVRGELDKQGRMVLPAGLLEGAGSSAR